MKPHLEILQLEHFLAVARAKNFTQAASELNLSQSSLSRSIQKLENQLGQSLFERRPREVVLTSVGEILYGKAQKILNLAEDTVSTLAEESENGQIRLGAIPTIAPYFLPGFLREFSQHHPNLTIHVQEDTSENLTKRCQSGELDLAILALPLFVRDLEMVELFEEELLLVVPSGHELASRDAHEITPEALEGIPFIALTEAHCLSESIRSFCRQKEIRPVSIERLSQLVTVQELVALGHGISLIPESARRLDQSSGRVYRSFAGTKPTRTVCLIWNRYRHKKKWLETTLGHLHQYSQNLREEKPEEP